MRINVGRSEFLKAIQTANRAVPGKTTKDILKNVKLISTDKSITLIGTDLEVGLRVDVADVKSTQPGEVLLPTARLIQVLTELATAEVDVEITGGHIWIRGGLSEFQLLTEDAQDFPPVATFNDDAFFTMGAADLARLIKRTVFATDSASSRYALGGVQIEFNQGKVVNFVATDSRRLAVDSAAFGAQNGPAAPSVAPVIPLKAVKLLASILEGTGEVQIALHTNDVAIRCGAISVTAQYVQGRFPDWRKVIPGNFTTSIDLVVGPFLSAIKQALIMRTEESRAIEFAVSKGRLRLSAEAVDLGTSKIDLPIAYDGDGMKICFDPSYLRDVLAVLDNAGTVSFNLISPDDPGLIETGSYRYIIMPLERNR